MTEGSRWQDLQTRVLTGAGLALVGGGAILLGGNSFLFVTALAAGVLVWELTRMIAPEAGNRAVVFALLSALAVALASDFDTPWAIGLAVLPAVLGLLTLGARRWPFFGFALVIQGAAYELVVLRLDFGATWLLWLLLVVIATDIAGYFAGKALGGPKVWPKISPKKTWSGTLGGWMASAVVGLGYVLSTEAGPLIVVLSVLLSMASQLGDIAESALKRSVGVKDSSDLLPGHGGVFDRFDGVLGAAVFMLVLAQLTSNPGFH